MWIESSDEAGRLGVLRHSANRRISQDQQRATFQLVAHTCLQGFLIPVRPDKLRHWQFEILRRIGEDAAERQSRDKQRTEDAFHGAHANASSPSRYSTVAIGANQMAAPV